MFSVSKTERKKYMQVIKKNSNIDLRKIRMGLNYLIGWTLQSFYFMILNNVNWSDCREFNEISNTPHTCWIEFKFVKHKGQWNTWKSAKCHLHMIEEQLCCVARTITTRKHGKHKGEWKWSATKSVQVTSVKRDSSFSSLCKLHTPFQSHHQLVHSSDWHAIFPTWIWPLT